MEKVDRGGKDTYALGSRTGGLLCGHQCLSSLSVFVDGAVDLWSVGYLVVILMWHETVNLAHPFLRKHMYTLQRL